MKIYPQVISHMCFYEMVACKELIFWWSLMENIITALLKLLRSDSKSLNKILNKIHDIFCGILIYKRVRKDTKYILNKNFLFLLLAIDDGSKFISPIY